MPKNWRRGILAPIEKEYDVDPNNRMRDTGEWRWAVPGILADIPEQVETLKQHQLGRKYTDQEIGSILNLGGFGTSPIRGGGVTLNAKPNYLELLHGTNAPPSFKSVAPNPDLHLTPNPDTANYFAMGGGDPWAEMPIAGGRVYPVLADPGKNPFKREWGMRDVYRWNSAKDSLKQIRSDIEEGTTIPTPQLQEIIDDLEKGITIPESLKKRGYTSAEYEHVDINTDTPGTAHLFTNPEQVIPKYSPEGILAAKEGRVKPIKEKRPYQEEILDEYAEQEMKEFQDPEFIRQTESDRMKKLRKYWGFE